MNKYQLKWSEESIEKFHQYRNLVIWLKEIEVDTNRCFVWENGTGHYCPSHIILDEQTALILKLK